MQGHAAAPTEAHRVPPTVRVAAAIAKSIALIEIGIPLAYVIIWFPGSLVALMFGLGMIAGPMLGLGFIGLGFARSLRAGRRRTGAAVFELIHVAIFVPIALHSATWDYSTDWDRTWFPVMRFGLWTGAFLSLCVALLLAIPVPKARYPGDETPALLPWLVIGVLMLAFAVCGIATPIGD